MTRTHLIALGALLGLAHFVVAEEPSPAERGRRALLGKCYNPPTIPLSAYENVWKVWGLAEKPAPADYARLFRQRYGFHEAPYANDGYPMGLRLGDSPLLGGKALATDCLICHGGSVGGQSYVGLGNTALDFQLFLEELGEAAGRRPKLPFTFTNVRGTSEAGSFAVFLLGYRQPDLNMRLSRLELGLRDDLCEDAPAWWLLKKKRTMYHTGGADARSVRSLMQFMMTPLNPPEAFDRAEADFRDIRAYLMTLEPPKYPLAIDRDLAEQGEKLFRATCSKCHGTYGPNWTYPNKIIPLEEIGTDPKRLEGVSRAFGDYYNRSWFAHERTTWYGGGYPLRETPGYQAPPLDGIWATAPYLHNGSVPTVYDVLNSKSRPKVFTRSYRTDLDVYDAKKLGWKGEVLREAPDPKTLPALEFRKVYDTSQPGRGNGGHTFGDHLSDEERFAIIEYLKTI
jgi:hypothetical protein